MSTLEQVKPAPVRSTEGGVKGWWDNTRTFIAEVRNETKRVTWPSRAEVYATTVVVILVSIFFGVYLFVLDYGLNSLFQWIIRTFGGV